MRKAAICLATTLVALAVVPLLAQSGANDTLSALLTEVRLLRMAIERSATAPELQLLGTRLAVQNDRLQEATRAHAQVRTELQGVSDRIAEHSAELQRTEEQIGANARADQREKLAEYERQLKHEIASLGLIETRLRARESELAAALGAEQNQWLLMNQRLDELERALKVR